MTTSATLTCSSRYAHPASPVTPPAAAARVRACTRAALLCGAVVCDTKRCAVLPLQVYEKGVMTRHLDGLKVGDTIDVRGPKGNYTYVAGHHSALLMLAGGTGITPMFQIIKAIAKVR